MDSRGSSMVSIQQFMTHVCTAITILVSLRATTEARPTRSLLSSTTTNEARWHLPCAGSSIVVPLGHIWEEYEGIMPTIDPGVHFERIAEKAREIKDKVHTLKSKYVSERFTGVRFVQDLDKMKVKLDGMPSPTPSERSVSNVNIISTVQKSIENLARGAVFLDQVRIDETVYSHDDTSYKTHFTAIENQGIYWLMCEMQQFLVAEDRYVNSDVTRDIMSIQLRDITTRSSRHMRDYIILRDLWKILDKVHRDFTMLKEHVER